MRRGEWMCVGREVSVTEVKRSGDRDLLGGRAWKIMVGSLHHPKGRGEA